MLLAVIAQMAQDIAGNPAGLYVYGPLGVICGFFMLISVKLVALGAKLVTAIKEDSLELRKEIRAQTHQIEGWRRAVVADMVERDSTGFLTKKWCREEIQRIDAARSARAENPG